MLEIVAKIFKLKLVDLELVVATFVSFVISPGFTRLDSMHGVLSKYNLSTMLCKKYTNNVNKNIKEPGQCHKMTAWFTASKT